MTRLRNLPRLRRWCLRLAAGALVVAVVVVAAATIWTRQASAPFRYSSVAEVPARAVALVLGNRAYQPTGISRIFRGRLDTARQLYAAGKVRTILVSGDHQTDRYNEVDPAIRWLVRHGVPAEAIMGDHFGLDTYSSCQRAVRNFGVREAIVVTQAYHLPRAVTLCRGVGLNAVGVAAEAPGVPAYDLWRRTARDAVASVKAGLELLARPDPQGPR